MFRRLFGSKRNKLKKRISPGAKSPDSLMQSHPMYQYAMNEYAQTVAPATSNDDGMSVFSNKQQQLPLQQEDAQLETIRSRHSDVESTRSEATPNSPAQSFSQQKQPQQQQQPPGTMLRSESDMRSRSRSELANPSISKHDDSSSYTSFGPRQQVQPSGVISPQGEYVLTEASTPLPSSPGSSALPPYNHQTHNTDRWPTSSSGPSTNISSSRDYTSPDTTYEEYYGDAYVGGPIRYIYPSGYQSMRPRSGPWKLSIVVCLMMSWLSIFIIGHCSNRVDQSLYNQNEIDDDAFVIEIRWCGSRMLYGMWVISMLITGIATAYCSVIGYIKVRDFAVGNMRSQPPGLVGKSDYYVQIHDDPHHDRPFPSHDDHYYDGTQHSESTTSSSGGRRYQRTIYQADGTPLFWGHHIYRPTQAAVAMTNR
jgi:hypothetical protein